MVSLKGDVGWRCAGHIEDIYCNKPIHSNSSATVAASWTSMPPLRDLPLPHNQFLTSQTLLVDALVSRTPGHRT